MTTWICELSNKVLGWQGELASGFPMSASLPWAIHLIAELMLGKTVEILDASGEFCWTWLKLVSMVESEDRMPFNNSHDFWFCSQSLKRLSRVTLKFAMSAKNK